MQEMVHVQYDNCTGFSQAQEHTICSHHKHNQSWGACVYKSLSVAVFSMLDRQQIIL